MEIGVVLCFLDNPDTVTRYIYDNEDILLELDGSNNITARYTHGPGIDEPLIMERGGASFFYHADGLGSITEITDAAGVLKQQYTYSSFGKIESQLDPTFIQPYTFTSREFDPETGFYHYRRRDLDPNTGRFQQPDPITFAAGPNFYVYLGNNPLTFVDPLGLVGIYGGVSYRATAPAISGEVAGRLVIGSQGNAVRSSLAGGLGATILAGGAAIGRGLEGGFFITDVSDFLNSNSINIDTPIGGLSIFVDNNGKFVGLGIGGPSFGLGVSFTTPDTSVGFTLDLFKFKLLSQLQRAACAN